ncbi:hypothetical protein ACOSQ2_018721 [Xanthoceras sorbifolium]
MSFLVTQLGVAILLGLFVVVSPSYSRLSGNEAWWKFLWRMSIPHRIKMFLWKASKNWLPTKSNLFAHKVPVDNLCPLCMKANESTVYALQNCSLLHQVHSDLVAFDIRLSDQIVNESSFIDLVLWFMNRAPATSFDILCVVWWRVETMVIEK